MNKIGVSKELAVTSDKISYNKLTAMEMFIFILLVFLPAYIGVTYGEKEFVVATFNVLFIFFVSFRDIYYFDKKNQCLVGNIKTGTMFSHFSSSCFPRSKVWIYNANDKLYVSSKLSSSQIFKILHFKNILFFVDILAFLLFPFLPSILMVLMGATFPCLAYSAFGFVLGILLLYGCSRKVSIPSFYTEFTLAYTKREDVQLDPFKTEIVKRFLMLVCFILVWFILYK